MSNANSISEKIKFGVEVLSEEQGIAQAIGTSETFQNAQKISEARNLDTTFETATNPLANIPQKSIRNRKAEPASTSSRAEKKIVVETDEQRKQADQFAKQSGGELKPKQLLNFLDKIKTAKSKEDILKLLEIFYTDPSLAEQALNFLVSTTRGELQDFVLEAQAEFQQKNKFPLEALKGIQIPISHLPLEERTTYRTQYKNMLQESPEMTVCQFFLMYFKQYPKFSQLKSFISVISRLLGADFKSTSPLIERARLMAQFSLGRIIQGGQGLLLFFRNCMPRIKTEFAKKGIPFPQELTFEVLCTCYFTLLDERYPSPDKVLNSIPFASSLPIEGKIILVNLFRDALPQTSTTLVFRSPQHRSEITDCILKTSENLEDDLDAQESQEWEKEDQFDVSKK